MNESVEAGRQIAERAIRYAGQNDVMSTAHRVELAIAVGALIGILLGPAIAVIVWQLGDGDSGF